MSVYVILGEGRESPDEAYDTSRRGQAGEPADIVFGPLTDFTIHYCGHQYRLSFAEHTGRNPYFLEKEGDCWKFGSDYFGRLNVISGEQLEAYKQVFEHILVESAADAEQFSAECRGDSHIGPPPSQA